MAKINLEDYLNGLKSALEVKDEEKLKEKHKDAISPDEESLHHILLAFKDKKYFSDFFRAGSSVPADVTSPYAKLNLKPKTKERYHEQSK